MKEQKFNQIVEENSERIQRICRYYCRNESEQKDLYQEILINIWKSLNNFKSNAAISTWIYRIAVNVSLTYNRKSIKHFNLFVDAQTENLHSVMDEVSATEQEQQVETLQNALNNLSVIDKTLISLVLEGLSNKEIAQIVGITEPNVKVKIHRIKATLKAQFKNQ